MLISDYPFAIKAYAHFIYIWDALEELGYDLSYLKKGAESCDVIIRCYLLGQAISEVLDEIEIK